MRGCPIPGSRQRARPRMARAFATRRPARGSSCAGRAPIARPAGPSFSPDGSRPIRRSARATTARGPRRPTSAGSAASSSSTATATPRRWVRRRSAAFLATWRCAATCRASTQNQAFSALLFLYRDVLGARARRPRRGACAPSARRACRSCSDARRGAARPAQLRGHARLMALAALRQRACACSSAAGCASRTSTSHRGEIIVRDGKGRKDRVTVLPARLARPLCAAPRARRRSAPARPGRWRRQRRAARRARPQVPERRPRVGAGSGSSRRRASYVDPRPARARRHHLHESVVQRAVRDRRARAPASPSRPPATPCATPSRPTCSRPATTSARSRSCSATATSRRR